MEYVIYDTNYFVKQLVDGEDLINKPFLFTDINLCEWLKGKDKNIRKIEFLKIDSFIKRKNSMYKFRSQYQELEEKLNKTKCQNYRFKIADKIAKKIFKDLMGFYTTICFVLPMAIFIKENNTTIGDGEFTILNENDYVAATMNHALHNTWTRFNKEGLFKIASCLYTAPKKEIDEFGIKLINTVIDSINNHSSTFSLRPISNKFLNHQNLIVDSNINFTKGDLEIAVNTFMDFTNNNEKSKEFFIKLLEPPIINSGRFEFNDIADRYLNYICETIPLEFITGDDRFKTIK